MTPSQWTWLRQPPAPYRWTFFARVLLKAAVLFVVANLVFALADPLPMLGRVSVYNALVPGRLRLPYGENSAQSYNLSLDSLDALFASHESARAKAADEFRVLVFGDSATWGFLLRPAETLSGQLNALRLTAGDGRAMRFYNLGYPEMSLTKDLLLIDRAMQLQPDLIVWAVTLESFAPDDQLAPVLVRRNPEPMRRLIETYGLSLDADDARFYTPSLWDKTLVGRRRDLADWLRLQLYGFAWAATGIDQYYPDTFTPRASDFEPDVSWHGFAQPRAYTPDEVAFDVLDAGLQRAGGVPVLIVNEPTFVSAGANSDLRYNFWYPRWAYDRYRVLLHELADARGWTLLDAWDAVAPAEFTDSPVHMTPAGTYQLAGRVAESVAALAGVAGG